jgi:predicted permease
MVVNAVYRGHAGSMASVVIMAKELGADDHLAVGNVFVSPIISILILPAVLLAINLFL